MFGGKRLLVEYVQAPRLRLCRRAGRRLKAGSSTMGPRAVLMSKRCPLHQTQLVSTHQALLCAR